MTPSPPAGGGTSTPKPRRTLDPKLDVVFKLFFSRNEELERWGRFLAAGSDEELEELAMSDPVMGKAKQALDVLGVELDDARREALARMELADLERLHEALRTRRRWPDD